MWSLHGHTVRERALAEIQSWEEITKSGQIPSVSSGFVKYFLTGKGILIIVESNHKYDLRGAIIAR